MSQGNRVENIILFRELQEAQNECCSTDCLPQALRTLLHRQYLPEQVTNNLKERAQQVTPVATTQISVVLKQPLRMCKQMSMAVLR